MSLNLREALKNVLTNNSAKAVAMTLVVGLSLIQTACNDREIVAGMIGATVGAIIVDSAHRSSPPEPRRSRRCEIVERYVCYPVSTYYGHRVEECGYRDVDTCTGRIYRKMDMSSGSVAQLDAVAISETYSMPLAGAQKFVSALQTANAAASDEAAQTALSEVGIDLKELKSLGQSGDPSIAMIDRVAKALNHDKVETGKMVTSMIEVARAQQAAKYQNQNDSSD